MQAMVLHQRASIHTAPLQWGEVGTPVPGPGEVRLRVRCCAICRTDLHVIEGDLPQQKLPVIPGHQTPATPARTAGTCWPKRRRFRSARIRRSIR